MTQFNEDDTALRFRDTSDLFPSVWPFMESDLFLIPDSFLFLSQPQPFSSYNYQQQLSNSDVYDSVVVIHVTPGKYMVKTFTFYLVCVNSCRSSLIIKTLVNVRYYFSHWLSPGSLADEGQHIHPQAKSVNPLRACFEAREGIMYAVCTDAFFQCRWPPWFQTSDRWSSSMCCSAGYLYSPHPSVC